MDTKLRVMSAGCRCHSVVFCFQNKSKSSIEKKTHTHTDDGSSSMFVCSQKFLIFCWFFFRLDSCQISFVFSFKLDYKNISNSTNTQIHYTYTLYRQLRTRVRLKRNVFDRFIWPAFYSEGTIITFSYSIHSLSLHSKSKHTKKITAAASTPRVSR